MKQEYDREKAARLVPLLRSITRELLDRAQAIELLEARLETRGQTEKRRGATESANTRSELAQQRRDLRLARQELARLGCALDEDHPLRILIPGEKGDIHSGFAWSLADEEPRPLSVSSAR
jgi:hypothetical protein